MQDIKVLFNRYSQIGLLVDTNILLLYVVGLVNPQRITRFKRTQQFTPEDYELLNKILLSFKRIFTTPHILTEVNSLANQLGEPERTRCFQILAQIINELEEYYKPSREVAQHPEFQRFGLTDCSILTLAQNSYLVLTDDLKLAVQLQRNGIDTVNFNNLRFLG